jgi:Na+/glutamate symporter
MITKLLSTLKQFAFPLLICYAAVITLLSLMSLHHLPEINFDHNDKIYHALAYTVFAVLAYNYFQKILSRNVTYISFLVCFFYGIILEVLQKVLNTNRTFDTLDILANGLGILIGLFVIERLYKLKLN